MPLVVILQYLCGGLKNSSVFGEEEKGSATEVAVILTF